MSYTVLLPCSYDARTSYDTGTSYASPDAGIVAEGLGKRFGDLWALRDLDLDVPAGHRPRPARPQRRRQDHGRPHPHHARRSRRRAARTRRRLRRRRRAGRGARPHRPRRPGTPPSTAAHRPREPRDGRPAPPPAARRGRARRADELLERFGLADAADRLVQHLLRRHAPPARPRREPRRPPARALPRRAHHRARPARAATSCGTSCATSSRDGTTLLLTTQYLEEADRLADDIVVLDHGRVVAHGTPGRAQGAGRRRADRRHAWPRRASSTRGRGGARAVRRRQPASTPAEPLVDRAGAARHAAARGRPRARRRRRRRRRRHRREADARRRLPHPHRTTPRPTDWRSPPDDRHPVTARPPGAAGARATASRSPAATSPTSARSPRSCSTSRSSRSCSCCCSRYVFGGAIAVPGGDYHEFLIGGILVQTLAFGIMGPATSIADGPGEGVVDRFRSLPMARSAFLLGHFAGRPGRRAARVAVADPVATGLIVGWGIHSERPRRARRLRAAAAVRLRDDLGRARCSALVARSPDAVQGFVFIVVFPLTFLANAFVPTAGLPAACARSPSGTRSARSSRRCATLFGNPTAIPARRAWPLAAPGGQRGHVVRGAAGRHGAADDRGLPQAHGGLKKRCASRPPRWPGFRPDLGHPELHVLHHPPHRNRTDPHRARPGLRLLWPPACIPTLSSAATRRCGSSTTTTRP